MLFKTNVLVRCWLVAMVLGLVFSPVAWAMCVESDTVLCLTEERFQVEVNWTTAQGSSGQGMVVPFQSADSGLFWFFEPDNWELMIKVLDACSFSDRFWVFSAATTNVAYTLRVTDTVTGVTRTYTNPQGTRSAAITDTAAFATCNGDGGLPPDPGEEGRATLEGIDSDGDGVRDDVQRYIALTYPDEMLLQATLTEMTKAGQAALVDADTGDSALDHATTMISAVDCLFGQQVDDPGRAAKLLMAEVLNTDQRGREYLKHNSHLGGNVFPGRSPDEWAISCGEIGIDAVLLPPIEKMGQFCTNTESAIDTAIYFTNGIWNDCVGARASFRTLQANMLSFLPASETNDISFGLIYNEGNLLLDIFEALVQQLNITFVQFYRWLANIDPMPDAVRDVFVQVADTASVAAQITNSDLRAHISSYRGDIVSRKKVVVIAHSQGNLFVNQAYDALSASERESFGTVAVATPAFFVAGNGPHTTITQDLMIILLTGGRIPNVSNGPLVYGLDITGHRFVESYMGWPNSRNQILNQFRAVRQGLVEPNTEGSQGIITATLTWGLEPDVDLHAFEPNGAHVYYANKEGPSGELDVDDIFQRGPEHYTVQCSTLETGIYRIGVNYFSGSGPEVADVQIQAGLTVRSFSIPLTTPRGFGGDNSPLPVANIIVTGNENDGFEFRIE